VGEGEGVGEGEDVGEKRGGEGEGVGQGEGETGITWLIAILVNLLVLLLTLPPPLLTHWQTWWCCCNPPTLSLTCQRLRLLAGPVVISLLAVSLARRCLC
jgi:hypothetical protein